MKKCAILLTSLLLCILFVSCSFQKSEQKQAGSEEYDCCLLSADGYNFVVKHEDTFEGTYDTVGVIDDSGRWILPLTSEHPFIINKYFGGLDDSYGMASDAASGRQIYTETVWGWSAGKKLSYLENGWFALTRAETFGGEKKYVLYNVNTKAELQLSCKFVRAFRNGYMMTASDDKVMIVSENGEIIQTDIEASGIGDYSDGLFYAGNCFYDLSGKLVIDLSAYDIQGTPMFENGKCELEIRNDGGTLYIVEIDKTGRFLSEPTRK